MRQGRTDAWIAHKLDVSVEQLDQFKRDQGLDGEPAAPEQRAEPSVEPTEYGDFQEDESEAREPEAEAEPADEAPEPEPEPEAAEPEPASEPARRRRRGRRGGRRRPSRAQASFEATFDHGAEGYGLWLDPAVADEEVYTEHWAGHRAVAVTVEPDAITIRRVEEGRGRDPEDY